MGRHPVAVVISHITYARIMKVDYSRFNWGGLHGKHVVVTWKGKTETIPTFALGPRKTKKNLCQYGRSQDLRWPVAGPLMPGRKTLDSGSQDLRSLMLEQVRYVPYPFVLNNSMFRCSKYNDNDCQIRLSVQPSARREQIGSHNERIFTKFHISLFF
jgi:hypothetical protein